MLSSFLMIIAVLSAMSCSVMGKITRKKIEKIKSGIKNIDDVKPIIKLLDDTKNYRISSRKPRSTLVARG